MSKSSFLPNESHFGSFSYEFLWGGSEMVIWVPKLEYNWLPNVFWRLWLICEIMIGVVWIEAFKSITLLCCQHNRVFFLCWSPVVNGPDDNMQRLSSSSRLFILIIMIMSSEKGEPFVHRLKIWISRWQHEVLFFQPISILFGGNRLFVYRVSLYSHHSHGRMA